MFKSYVIALKKVLSIFDSNESVELHPYNQLINRIEQLPQITVAAINGHAAGGGLELTLACDFRLVMQGEFGFGVPEIFNGIIPGGGGTQRLPRIIGRANTLDLVISGRLLSPDQALAMGLVHQVLPAEGFIEAVAKFAEKLSRRAPLAVKAAKAAIYGGESLDLQEGLAWEHRCFDQAADTEDAKGSMEAFFKGEKYEFQGK